MSEFFAYVCTKQTADPFVPSVAANLDNLARDVSDGFYAIQGGHLRVGQIAFFPVQRAVPFHLLCDGSEVAKADFPELFEYLADSQGTPADADNFVLPNFLGTFAPAVTATPEVVEGGTVTSETPTPGTGDSGGSIDFAVDSGARNRKFYDPYS